MNLLLNTYRPEFHDGCEYAYVEITPAFANLILARKQAYDALLAADSSLATIEFHSDEVDYLSDIPQNFPEVDDDESFVEVDIDIKEFTGLIERTECNRMVIGRDDVYWTCIPKHCDWHAETRPVDYQTIREALA